MVELGAVTIRPSAAEAMPQPSACRLLLLGLAALAAPAEGLNSTNGSFPMQPPFLSTACSCDDGSGYSPQLQMCMKGIFTACSVCPYQKRCAKISTLVGDGIRAFGGDCRITPSGARSQCEPGAESSLAFAGSIARDDQDNLYIADFGNNRIRKWDQQTDTVTTIAGSGEIGFSGDGGPARSARLRQPEGIALKPGMPADQLQVYFSDFKNQRIRRLTLRNGTWYIDTVAGIGTKGDAGPSCDEGCNATTQAILDNPRALAFSSMGDLFIADSGNRKIRKLTPDGIFSTAIGANTSLAPVDDSLLPPAKKLLPGHWSQPSKTVSIGTLYVLTVDNYDNLWFMDGPSPRIWKTPLSPRTETRPAESSGRMLTFYLNNFYSSPIEKELVQGRASSALAAWASWVLNITRPEIITTREDVGYTYWVYGQGTNGNWCQHNTRQEQCTHIAAQDMKLKGALGMCFDIADNMYISDADASQLLYIEKESINIITSRTMMPSQRKTTRNCKCHKFWFDTNVQNLDQRLVDIFNPMSWPDKAALCKQNPVVAQIVSELPPHLATIQFPECKTTNYCAPGSENIDTCFIVKTDPGDVCFAEAGYCSKHGLAVNFEAVPKVAILGNELNRRTVLSTASHQEVANLVPVLTQDLWLQISLNELQDPLRRKWPQLPWGELAIEGANNTMLIGFVSSGNPPSSLNCSSACCELPELNISIPSTQPTQQKIGSGAAATPLPITSQSKVCALSSLADIPTLQAYAGVRHIYLVWQLLFNAPVTITDCEERCMLDETCTSFMVAYNDSANLPSETGPCIGFSKNDPFSIYTFDRAGLANSALASLTSAQLTTFRFAYAGPKSPYSRLFNSNGDEGVYVSGDGTRMKDLLPGGGPHHSYALNVQECEDLCTRTADCYAIAYPGCYLLNRTNILTQDGDNVNIHGEKMIKTMVYVKKYMDKKVEGLAGKPEVFTFQGEDALLREAYLNKPGPCVVSSKGDLIFTDIWNQRIRKITGRNMECLHALDSGRSTYIAATQEATTNCTSSPRMNQLYERVQREVVQQRSLVSLKREFCNFLPPVDAGYLQTNNTFILCELCAQMWAPDDPLRPQICPWQELCHCTTATVEVLKTEVFKLCPFQNAHHDKWHFWVSSFLHCLVEGEPDVVYLSNSTLREQLYTRLQAYAR